MKVFYVVVLVLVAVAGLSHGRTESEGTVFNKSQPHEIINNVTVSSSKVETYEYLCLSMQWPRTYCFSTPCYRIAPLHFTVHGLWPQSKSGKGIDCPGTSFYRRFPLFERRQLDEGLVDRLNVKWPDLRTSENNNPCFWGSEYGKHGSCTYNDQNKYFEQALSLADHLGDLILRIREGPRENGPRISNGNYYFPGDIRYAVLRFTSLEPMLHCITIRRIVYLSEIRFCARPDARQLGSCVFTSNCGNGKVLLP